MRCHDIQLMIPGFVEDRLSNEQLEAFLEHIRSCQDCYDELEVYYIITTGLMLLDEDHSETLDLKKNLRELIQQKEDSLYVRKKQCRRKKGLKYLLTAVILIISAFTLYTFGTDEDGIHSAAEFESQAIGIVQKFWVGQDQQHISDSIEHEMQAVLSRYHDKYEKPYSMNGFYYYDRSLPARK